MKIKPTVLSLLALSAIIVTGMPAEEQAFALVKMRRHAAGNFRRKQSAIFELVCPRKGTYSSNSSTVLLRKKSTNRSRSKFDNIDGTKDEVAPT